MAIAGIIFACVFAGALLGMYLRTVLPDGHLNADTKDVVKVAIALVATMTALILSLLISSAKSAYDTRNSQLLQISADIIAIDRTLAHYGPDAKDARALLRGTVAAGIERLWPTSGARPVGFDLTSSPAEALYNKIEELSPQTESQRSLRAQALQAVPEIGRLRFLFIEQAGISIPIPFLVVMVFWLTIIFSQFWPVCAHQRDCSRCIPGLRVISRRRDFSDPGARSILRGIDPGIERTAAAGACSAQSLELDGAVCTVSLVH